MPNQRRVVSPGPDSRSVRADNGQILHPPADWVLVPPGDPALTRRLKAGGPTWTVQERRGRKVFSRGLWVDASRVQAIRAELETERAQPAYARKREADARRRERNQTEYVEDFRDAVLQFLDFHDRHAAVAERLADAVARHATPVGSGTVARTQRVPIAQRAEAAVIAWLRHKTTAYDQMAIPRIKGKRREIRRILAERSRSLLRAYRDGQDVNRETCPLCIALQSNAQG